MRRNAHAAGRQGLMHQQALDSAQDMGRETLGTRTQSARGRGGVPGAVYFTSAPVWPSQSHPNSYSSTSTACPSAGSSCPQTWSHFKEKPSGHTPSRCREANRGSATPLMERCAVANGRAGDGWGKLRFGDQLGKP